MTPTSTTTRTGVTVSGMARAPGWRVVPALIAALIVLIPLVYLAVRAGEIPFDRVVGVLFESRAIDYTLNTLALAVSVALSALLGGVTIAVGMSRGRFPRPRLWLVLAALPLAIPSYLASYGWLVWSPTLSGFWPSWALLTAVTIPYVILPTAAALRTVGGDQERVARTLGKNPFNAFWVATWPHIRPAALAGTLLVFLYSVSDFGLVAMLRFHTLTWGVNAAYSASFDRNQAAVLAILVVLLALIGVLGERRVRGQRQLAPGRSKPIGPRPAPAVRRALMALSLTPLVVGVVVPLLGLGVRLFQVETAQTVDVGRLVAATLWTVAVAIAAAVA
ncbi:MAG: ABC transporter permease subunit, partial [Pontimonas sp.]